MAVVMKLKHVDELSGGRKRFRRRYPKDVAEVLGEGVFQCAMASRDGAELMTEHARLLVEYERIVEKVRRSAAERGTLSARELWKEALQEARSLVSGVTGARDTDEARMLVAEDLQRRGAEPILIRAVLDPKFKYRENKKLKPKVTLLDAKEMYRKERMQGAVGRNQANRLERVCRRIETSLGPLDDLPLVKLKRKHARKLRDDMLATKKRDGSPLSPSSVRRELDMIKAIVATGIKEFDLKGKADNPFEGLDFPADDKAPGNEWELRDPLPKDVLLAMRARMAAKLREPALGLIWRLLEGTGCRGAEIVGLRVEDVEVSGPYPHIRVQWHEDRRVKTKVSIRSVPLVGDALIAATEAVRLAGEDRMLFPRYAHEGGPDAVSQALMKHLRRFTANKRHVVYSLRHNMKDYLVTAEVPERDEHRILGHSLGGVGNRVYGGDLAKLKVATDAMKRAHEQIPQA